MSSVPTAAPFVVFAMLPVGSASWFEGSVFALVLPYVSSPDSQWLLEGDSCSSWLDHNTLLVDILPDKVPLGELFILLLVSLFVAFFVAEQV